MDHRLQILFEKLRDKSAFWSYNSVTEIPDDILIEKVMLMLDLDDINYVFNIYSKDHIRKIWDDNILKLEPYYHGLNRFFAWYYFDIEDPDEYIRVRSNHLFT